MKYPRQKRDVFRFCPGYFIPDPILFKISNGIALLEGLPGTPLGRIIAAVWLQATFKVTGQMALQLGGIIATVWLEDTQEQAPMAGRFGKPSK